MNVELLERVIKHIEEEPRRLAMGTWGTPVDDRMYDSPPCGTIACIAGWANFLSKEHDPFGRELGMRSFLMVPSTAMKNLQITEEQARRLFYVHEWTEPFKTDYQSNYKTKEERAEIAIARIRHFIETGE